ncbi:hypothetical protein HOP62_16635 [Halomonas sp. MCCC 1A17488]|uniref:hypothetical protein n=1 Tax=unclassified Halomonas TaxID=2609666 RepID=UPI0018D2630F|nr:MULTISPECIES: hypothetical protein [unclassified Halomonas]MCE8017707.1 hypothetical protein [Halomonas sp. MCCC 1A17488]MCG3241040.1 hypothetical protein [Halomonas sp. MCCC 1A17488]QPP48902.1 hypothetical protein I4484_17085 [Halomonas sp. SS10-MC5]
MFASTEELRAAILATEPALFVSRCIIEPIPYAFAGDAELWIDWKTRLAAHLEVDPYEIVLAGSGALGYSLNPHKGFSSFHSDSDIDVCVISLYHFEAAWRYLRQTRSSWLSLPAKTRRSLDFHRKNYVFSGTIATDLILPLLPFGKRWQEGLDDMSVQPPTRGREVKLRIYRDYDALRAYQAEGVKSLRTELLHIAEAEEEIPLQE